MKKAAKKKVSVKNNTVRKVAPIMAVQRSPREEAQSNVDDSLRTGNWLVITLRIENKTILLNRTAVNFPKDDIDTALTMIGNDLNKLKVG